MAFDLATIRADLVDVLEGVSGIGDVHSTIRANYSPPCVMIGYPSEIEYHIDAGGCIHRADLTVRVVATGLDPDETAAALDAALSSGVDGSVFDALEAEAYASGRAWSQMTVVGVSDVVPIAQGDTEVAQADMIVRIYA